MRIGAVLACAVVSVVARPEQPAARTPVPILMDERTPIDAMGGYGFRIQTGDGLTWAETAEPSGPLNQVTRTGQYRFVHPDGTPHLLTYVAGVGGFQAFSDHIPTPHPLEPWHIQQIEFAAQEKAKTS